MRLSRLLLLLLGIPILLAAALASAMFLESRADPVVRQADVTLPGLPPGTALRIVLMSDIHIGNASMDAARLDRIVGQVNALRPDLVLIAGDFIFGHDPGGASKLGPPMVAPLRRLRARFGTVAVLGNHDYWTGREVVRAELAWAGVALLDNAATVRGPIAIGGIGDGFTAHSDVPATMRAVRALGRPFLLLTHSPDVASRLPPDARLLLAGHTHCGQAVLPVIGSIAPHVIHDARYQCGLVRDSGRTVVVTGGLGTSGLPLRIGAPPDLWLVTLRASR